MEFDFLKLHLIDHQIFQIILITFYGRTDMNSYSCGLAHFNHFIGLVIISC